MYKSQELTSKKSADLERRAPHITAPGVLAGMTRRFGALPRFSFDELRIPYNSGKPAQLTLDLEAMEAVYKQLRGSSAGEMFLETVYFEDLVNKKHKVYKCNHTDKKFVLESETPFADGEKEEIESKLTKGEIPVYNTASKSVKCTSSDNARAFRHELGHAMQGAGAIAAMELTTLYEMDNVLRHENMGEKDPRLYYKFLHSEKMAEIEAVKSGVSELLDEAAGKSVAVDPTVATSAAESGTIRKSIPKESFLDTAEKLENLKISQTKLDALTERKTRTPLEATSKLYPAEETDDNSGTAQVVSSFIVETATEFFAKYKNSMESIKMDTLDKQEKMFAILKNVSSVLQSSYASLKEQGATHDIKILITTKIENCKAWFDELKTANALLVNSKAEALKAEIKKSTVQVGSEEEEGYNAALDLLDCNIKYLVKNLKEFWNSYSGLFAALATQKEELDKLDTFAKAITSSANLFDIDDD